MSPEPAGAAQRASTWATLVRRGDPFIDPVLGLVAVALSVGSLVATDVTTIDPRLHQADGFSVLATVVTAGSLAWRRSRPMTSYAVFLAGAVVVSGTFHYIGLLSVLLPLSMFSLSLYGTRRAGVVGLGFGVGCFLALGLAGVPDLRAKDIVLAIAILVAAWAAAEALRSRRDLQRDRVQGAVTEERLRIARELHDVVAHSMSLIAVQAGVGAHVIGTDPAAAAQSLEVIADTSRKALEQTRSMLGILRAGTETGTRPPTQGLGDLTALVEDVRAAGLEVAIVGDTGGGGVEPVVSLAAYRIVQESLTNVIRHSAAATATVTLAVNDRTLRIEVSDPGPRRVPASVNGSGHGLVGLDERARLVGGSLEYGAQGDGFAVHAALPGRAGR